MSTITSSLVSTIMENEAERTFWEVVRHHERPPYFFDNEGVGNRLNRAARVVLEGRLHPNSDGSFTIEGSEGRTYRVADRCSCPQSQRGKSHWCYHHISVMLYLEWTRRQRTTPPPLGQEDAATRRHEDAARDDDDVLESGYPVDDETLPLPLPPTSVEERLAAPGVQEPLGAPMTEDDVPYIPEPDGAPVATLEPPAPRRALTPVQPETSDLETALQVWTTERAIVQRFLKQELKANIDYYTLRIGGKDSKPSLSKAGAEKVMGWLKLQASFAPDTGTWEMLGRPQDMVVYICTLRTRSGEIVGEGRGARSIKKDGGDVNKAIKMAEKSANVSAVLRTGCLSDVFTQDAEDMQEPELPPAPAKATSQELRSRIWAIVKERAAGLTERAEVEAWIKTQTGYDLHPDHYQAILNRLQGKV